MPYEEDYKMWLEKSLIEMNPDWVCDGMTDKEFTHKWCEENCGKDNAYITPKCLHMYYHHIVRAEQTEPQKTTDYCDTCNHKGCENCVGDNSNPYCVPSRYEPKDEPNSSEKPNNCEYAENPSGDVWECGCFLDTYCEHQIYDRNPDGTINIVECGYEPKDEPMKTTDYCDICKRDMCEDCIADATNPYCVPSHYEINYEPKDEPQTERSE